MEGAGGLHRGYQLTGSGPGAVRRATPQLQTARVLGSGHYVPQEVPEQVNDMIARFIRINDTPKDTIA